MTIGHSQPANTSLNLVLAVIASSDAPLLLLDGHCKVIAASRSFCRVYQIEEVDAPGRQLFELGAGEWDVRQLRSLLAATAAGHADIDAYEMDLKPEGRGVRRLVVSAKRLSYDFEDDVRLVLTIMDVTDARLADKLRQDAGREMAEIKQDKAMLLQELQHRVANSLQIIASVLLQTARKVQSDETRLHLQDAHHRVMSVAALQRKLAVSTRDDVQLGSYFADLCQSLGSSMIRDHNQISLNTVIDDTITTADVSVSLGLIVTELVINALKHAFPNERIGKIRVGYHSNGPDWTLTVTDDGVGMTGGAKDITRGLGSSIVNALARQLEGDITVTNANPGTTVSIVHSKETDSDGHHAAQQAEPAV